MDFQFGVLPETVRIAAKDWAVEPISECEEVIKVWRGLGSSNDWVYPPIQHSERSVGYDTERGDHIYERVPESERSALMWPVPPTHSLSYRGAAPLDPEETKNHIATFLIYLIGTLYGVEVKHADWAVVGRQKKKTGGLFVAPPGEAAKIIDDAAAWYGSLPSAELRTTITSALYLHNHVPGYEFAWERFAWQYSVFDAAWFVLTRDRTQSHGARLQVFAERIGAKSDAKEFANWVELRNDLMHQVLWGKAIPGHKPLKDVGHAYLSLRAFATIALMATVGYKGPGLQADWMSRARHRL